MYLPVQRIHHNKCNQKNYQYLIKFVKFSRWIWEGLDPFMKINPHCPQKQLSFSWTLPYGQIWLHFQTNLQRRNSDCLLEKMFLKYYIPDEFYKTTCEITLAQSKATAPKYKNKGSPYAYHATKAFTRSCKGRAKKWKFFMTFAIKRRTSPPLMALFSIFKTH